ncbi:hypothetical protein E8E11_000596 [Didymella keratinophila]|nr:hypothetical protein E8E11_000596 [Didymella keratinophila]
MLTPTRCSTALSAPLLTPLVRRVALDVCLTFSICLRCAKDYQPGARVLADVDNTCGEAAAFPPALRAWIKDVEATICKEAKQGGTSAEGILDVLWAKHGHLPLGALNAQSDHSAESDSGVPLSPVTFPVRKPKGKRGRPTVKPRRNLRPRIAKGTTAPPQEEV